MKVYLVGGAVRDEIMGNIPKDFDYVVVNSSHSEMKRLGYKSIGGELPVFQCKKNKDEYALARKETSTGPGYRDFVVEWKGVTLLEDLGRRDLTINAIAKNKENGEYIDPFGGISDAKSSVLKHISEKFVEDSYRLMRLARFFSQSEDMTIHPSTLELCKNKEFNLGLTAFSGEHLWREIRKILLSPCPWKGFEFLREVGALDIIFPELSQLYQVPQNEIYHPEGCCWTHTMLVLKSACDLSEKLEVRFCALVLDLGKGITPKDILPAHHDHEINGVPLVREVCSRFGVNSKCQKMAEKMCRFHLRVHRSLEMKPSKIVSLLENLDFKSKPDLFFGVLSACRADNMGKLKSEESYPQEIFLTKMREVLLSLDYSVVVAKHKGPRLKEHIHQLRVESLKVEMLKYENKFSGSSDK